MFGGISIKEEDGGEFDWCDRCDERIAFKAYHWDAYCGSFCEVCAEELGLVEAGHKLWEKCSLLKD